MTVRVVVTFTMLALVVRPAPGDRLNDEQRNPQSSRHTLDVAAGGHARQRAVVSFALPADLAGRRVQLRGANGVVLPVQVDAEGRAWFILPALARDAAVTFVVEPLGRAATETVSASRRADNVDVSLAGSPVVSYVGGVGVLPEPKIKPIFQRGGYIHPVRTPAGRIVTDDYPSDHYHHHGIWFAWTETTFEDRHPDFWNVAEGTGNVLVEGLDAVWGGPVHAGWRARHRYVDTSAPAPTTALREIWQTRVYAKGAPERSPHVFDVDIEQNAISSPLVLEEYRYGGIGLRGPAASRALDNVVFRTSEGRDRSNGDATRGRWVALSSRVDGATVGLAMLGHPDNFRAPEPLRLNPTDPFICFAAPQLGRFEIRPGTPYRLRYRFVAFDGEINPSELDRLWNDLATPPVVTVR